tara:strand:- start:291 stop:449 length:159 start_codon:yes stop_codon:yes gene_type:complete
MDGGESMQKVPPFPHAWEKVKTKNPSNPCVLLNDASTHMLVMALQTRANTFK